MKTPLFCSFAVSLTWAAVAGGQNTTVQQPTFNFNTVNTTVSAPDGGTIGLGGIKRASMGRVERGVPILGKMPYIGRLFNNRAIGQDFNHSFTTVTPRIIILEEEEAKLGLGDFGSGSPSGRVLGASLDAGRQPLIYAPQPRPLTADDQRALRLSQFVARNVPEQVVEEARPSGPSADEIRRSNELAAEQRDAEAVAFFDKGRAAEEAGKANVAQIYYKMAARRADGEFKRAIETRLDAVGQP